VVPVTPQQLLGGRRAELVEVIQTSFGKNKHSDAFVLRILGVSAIREIVGNVDIDSAIDSEKIPYQGFPAVAALGFLIAGGVLVSDEASAAFLMGVERLSTRPIASLATFLADDVALLGVTDGLVALTGRAQTSDRVAPLRLWLAGLLDRPPDAPGWSMRMRILAADLLDQRGRLQVASDDTDANVLALEYTLQSTWARAFIKTPAVDEQRRNRLLQELVTYAAPQSGDLERGAVWVKALDVLIDDACRSLTPSVSDTVRILQSVQAALRRWKWEANARRQGVMPTRWMIDTEYDVQALLWLILYPIYRDELVDETYLPSWGNVQARVDLGIKKLKLIIEVKLARRPGDFADIEEQVAGDVGLYFQDTNLFDRMIVFVYDDCDQPRPERYESLRNALKQRQRIEDVIIVRRPSMIPNRSDRPPV